MCSVLRQQNSVKSLARINAGLSVNSSNGIVSCKILCYTMPCMYKINNYVNCMSKSLCTIPSEVHVYCVSCGYHSHFLYPIVVAPTINNYGCANYIVSLSLF